MKFKTGLIVGAAIGFAAARYLAREDPDLVTEGSRNASGNHAAHPSRRMADRVTNAGMEAINRARANIQFRLSAADNPDDPTWN